MSREMRLTSGRQVGYGQIAMGVCAGVSLLAIAALAARRPRRRAELDTHGVSVGVARRLNRAAGALSFSVLADSALEHYRGSFRNRAMYTPLVVASLTLSASAHGGSDPRSSSHLVRDGVYVLAALTGVAGSCFHFYNVTKQPGGFAWENLFYGAPLGAPSAIILAGLLGFAAERVRDTESGETPTILGWPAGPALILVCGAGLCGTSIEAALLHFRGAFHDPFMFAPITLPPLAALALTLAPRSARLRGVARALLRLTTAMGLAGSGFHAYGVHRNMGGWRNWRQNVLNGPPLPAPPSFSGLALAGLAALDLVEEHANA